jgi:AmiR/NasT family two-component response regulator
LKTIKKCESLFALIAAHGLAVHQRVRLAEQAPAHSREQPDVVLRTSTWAGASGIDCVRQPATDPARLVVMLTAYEDGI